MALFSLSLAWMAGISMGPSAGLSSQQWAILAASSLAALLLFRRHKLQSRLFVIFFTISIAAWRAYVAQPELDKVHVSRFNDFTRPVQLTGVVVSPPDVRDSYVGLRVEAESIRAGQDEARPVHGFVLVRAERYLTWSYGDRIRASGYLATPPDDELFSYREYLARQGTFSMLKSRSTVRLAVDQANVFYGWLYHLRGHFHRSVRALFPEPEASLLSGILLGIESGIGPDVRQAFNATGTTHIIAISGFNITIIAGMFISFFGRAFGARRGMLAAGAGILLYTVLVGADAAVVRAAIMGGLSLLALRLGRRTHGLASLGAAAILMTGVTPTTLFDVGFQLSFAATLGMILYAEPLQNAFQAWLTKRWLVDSARAAALAGPVGEYLLFTLAAQLTTLPLTAFYFHRLSLASLVANPVILPAQPAVMVLGGLATLVGSAWVPAGQPLAWMAWPFASYTIRAVEWIAQMPLASLALGHLHPVWIVVFYGLLLILTAGNHLPGIPRPRLPAIPKLVALVALAVAVFFTWSVANHRPDRHLRVAVLDGHGGQAVLVSTPYGRAVLINGGRSPISLQASLGRRLAPSLRHIDWLVMSSSQEQDLIGLADLTDRFALGGVLADDSAGNGPAWALVRTLHTAGVPFAPLTAGSRLDLGLGAQLVVMSAADGEAGLEISMGRTVFLVLSGSQLEALAAESQSLASAQSPVVLLRQAGDVSPQTAEWMLRMVPMAVVVSSDSADGNSLPSPGLVDVFGDDRLLRTDQLGTIQFTTDGTQLWVTGQRQPSDLPGS
jgi:competence protein ComEC